MESKELSWWEFVEEYQKSEYSTVALADLLIPNATGFRTPGSPFGAISLAKQQRNKLTRE